MQKAMKSGFIIIGLCCAVAILVTGIVLAVPPKMLDFRGEVTEATIEGDVYTFRIVNGSAASYIVVADARSKVYRESDPKSVVSAQDIQVGDTIEGNYRRFTRDNEARFIRIWR